MAKSETKATLAQRVEQLEKAGKELHDSTVVLLMEQYHENPTKKTGKAYTNAVLRVASALTSWSTATTSRKARG